MPRDPQKSLEHYPESRDCSSPSAPRILEIFADAERHHLVSDGVIVQDFDPTLTSLQQKYPNFSTSPPASTFHKPPTEVGADSGR
jgi:uncharacterized protein YccT (UPF0319 family)